MAISYTMLLASASENNPSLSKFADEDLDNTVITLFLKIKPIFQTHLELLKPCKYITFLFYLNSFFQYMQYLTLCQILRRGVAEYWGVLSCLPTLAEYNAP